MIESRESTQEDAARYPSIWQNPDFVRFLSGEFITNLGDSLYVAAILWLVFELSGSTFLTGVANFLLLLPFLLQFIAGPIIDRFSIKRVLVLMQFVQGVTVLTIPIAAYTGHLSVGLILAVIPVLSLMTLILSPVQTALVPRIVSSSRLSKANSTLATATLGLDTVFEAFGALLISSFGAIKLFVADSLTFLVSGLLFLSMTVPPAEDGTEQSEESQESALSGYVNDLQEGIDILRGTVFVDMMFTSAVFHFALGMMLAILPAFGALRGGPAMYGLLLGVFGVGRMVGTVVAPRLEGVPYGRWKAVAYVGSAMLWVGSVYAPSAALTLGLFGLTWIPAGVNGVLVSTLNQKVFPETILGRISSVKGTASTATLPVGSLVGGFIAEFLGVTTTMGLAAFGFCFTGVYFALRSPLRNLPAIRDADPSDFNIPYPRNTDD